MAQPDERAPKPAPTPGLVEHAYDLKFIPTIVNDEPAGGWYRELPDGQIEVMTRAQLECVSIEDGDPEAKARETVEKMIKQQNP